MNDKWIKIKDIIPQFLAVAFILLVIFYPSQKNQLASILQVANQPESVPEIATDNLDEGYIGQEVVYYGQLRRFSTSGALGFDYYDIDKNKLQYDNPYVWFWATLPEAEDYKKIKPTLEFIVDQDNSTIYKIVGTRVADNSYYDPSVSKIPLQSIMIKSIQVYRGRF